MAIPATTTSPSSEQLRLARKRAAAKMGFFIHLTVFVLVNGGLILLDAFALRGRGFSMFPLFGWGLGLAIHGVVVFLLGSGAAIRDRMIDRELASMRRQER